MPIFISQGLRSKIIDTRDRTEIEFLLKQKSAGICFLCKQPLNLDTEKIVADHDIPETENGPTDYENLNLVHDTCNSFKSANSTLRIRKFLPLRRFLIDNPGSNFEQVSDKVFKIDNREVYLKVNNGLVHIEETNSSTTFGPFKIFTEVIGDLSPVNYIFARLPIKYLFNDDVQPRSIKTDQAFKIFQDLHINPLHEPVGARLEYPFNDYEIGHQGSNKILMFDGQHKTVARALFHAHGKSYDSVELDVKIYVNFTHDQAVRLVNSIQSLVPKLALTKSEFAKKMSEEFGPLFEDYLTRCESNGKVPTEKGFVTDAAPQDRRRYKNAIEQTRLRQLMTDEFGKEIEFLKLLHSKDRNWQLKETTLFNKVFTKFLITKQLTSPLDSEDTKRSIERKNIQLVLQLIFEELLTVSADNPIEHVKIFLTQSGLSLIGDLTKSYVHYVLMAGIAEDDFFDPNFEQKILDHLKEFYRRFRKHPIWSYHHNSGGKRRVEKFFTLVAQNQSLMAISNQICLNMPYCSGMLQIDSQCLDGNVVE